RIARDGRPNADPAASPLPSPDSAMNPAADIRDPVLRERLLARESIERNGPDDRNPSARAAATDERSNHRDPRASKTSRGGHALWVEAGRDATVMPEPDARGANDRSARHADRASQDGAQASATTAGDPSEPARTSRRPSDERRSREAEAGAPTNANRQSV